MESKVWWKSKTLWLQFLATIVAFLVTSLEPLRPYMTPEAFGVFVVVMGLVNVALRFVTTKPIVMRSDEETYR